jgi:hypothetical protein
MLDAGGLEVSEGRGIPFARGVRGAGSLEGETEVSGALFVPEIGVEGLARVKPARESRAARPCPEDAEDDGREVGWEVGREPDASGKAGTAPRSGTALIPNK